MTKMSNPQMNLVLAAHHRPAKVTPYGSRGEIVLSSRLVPSGEVLCRNGWAIQGSHGWLNVTRAGLIAAGIDMDALAAQAADEAAMEGYWIRGLINV
jgi:hypothetical protein